MAIIEVVEAHREPAGGLMDVYRSSSANRQNEVMKMLTIIASIFIPLTLLVGIYGVKFENAPGLRSTRGYPLLIAIMVVVGVGMTVYFKTV